MGEQSNLRSADVCLRGTREAPQPAF